MPSRLSMDKFAEGFLEACKSSNVDAGALIKLAQAARQPSPGQTPAQKKYEDFYARRRKQQPAARQQRTFLPGAGAALQSVVKPLTQNPLVNTLRRGQRGEYTPLQFGQVPEHYRSNLQERRREFREDIGRDPTWAERLAQRARSGVSAVGEEILPRRIRELPGEAETGAREFWGALTDPEYAEKKRRQEQLEERQERAQKALDLRQEQWERAHEIQQLADIRFREEQNEWRQAAYRARKELQAQGLSTGEINKRMAEWYKNNPKPVPPQIGPPEKKEKRLRKSFRIGRIV